MSTVVKSLLVFSFLFSAFAVSTPSFANTAEPAWKFNRAFNAWSRSLDAIETELANPDHAAHEDEGIRETLTKIREDAVTARDAAADFATNSGDLLAALGERPAEGEPEEARDVQQKRRQYEAEVADFRGRAAQAQLIIRRVDTLTLRLSGIEQGLAVATLLTRTPSPLEWGNLQTIPTAASTYFSRLAMAPLDWWRAPTEQGQTTLQRLTPLGVLIAILAVALFGRRLLVDWLGRDKRIPEPSYTRRLLGASTEALANGLLPALFAGLLWLTFNIAFSLNEGPFLNLVNGFVTALLIAIAALSLPRAALSPSLPNWRVVPIRPKYAQHLTQRIGALGILFGSDVFVSFTSAPADAAFLSIYSALTATLEAILIVDLLRPALWRADPDWSAGRGDEEQAPAQAKPYDRRRAFVWQGLRITIGLIALTGAVAAWIGYTALSIYLIGNLIGTALTFGALFLARALFAEWIGIIMRRKETADWLALSEEGSSTVAFWLISFMQVAVYITGAALIGAVWGIPLSDIWTITYNLLTGISVGGVTISFADILEAILVFIATLLIFRLIKRVLRDTVLPQTRLDPGAQYSIATVFGYVGIITAVLLTATTLGVEFQSLLIIAGALSVGIGFGLQNIANNFISGLILLFERPIKVGDLIEIGDTLGHITHINVRRTEVETFQRAEVMIPNSELVATSVINWTHSDRKARIEINVGVAYGSDTELVRETLIAAARNVEKIVSWPSPDVLFLDFGDSSLNFQLRCFTSDVSSRITTSSSLRFEIDRLFREAGIEIPFPQRVVHMASDDNKAK
ncbi:MAG: mechanosensitive ion channel family protein [Rhodobiaceae bacterium]|nr:mechanosensitive ion channel family protein [Rhodobiaceae bacterium]